MHCTGCIVRNNFVSRGPQAGLVTVYTRDCRLLNNTIFHPQNRLGRLIRVVFENENLLIANNLLCGPDIRIESESSIRRHANLAADVASLFVDPLRGNLHLGRADPRIVDRGAATADVTTDIHMRPRRNNPDLGAHEWQVKR